MHYKGPAALLLAGSIISSTAACGVLDLFDPDPVEPNDRVAVGTVLRMPEVTMPDGSSALSELTAASVFVGQRGAGADVLSAPAALTGATVQLTILDDSVVDVALPHAGDGFYTVTSEDEPALEYRAGAAYRATIDEGGSLYEMDVERAPSPEVPEGIPEAHQRDQPLTIGWSQRRSALVEVHRLSASGPVQTYTNRPSDIRELIAFALEKEPEEPTLTIPREAFQAAGPYVLVFFLLERGFPDSGLFAGSTLLVGAGEAVLFEVE